LNDDFSLASVDKDSAAAPFRKKTYSELPTAAQKKILNYDLVVQELSGYSDSDIRDMFTRMNKYVVPLSKQELRHAKLKGKFKDFVERLGAWPFWQTKRVFTKAQLNRMRSAEFSAELAILLLEGPQDKKQAIDLYYINYQSSFSEGQSVEQRLRAYLDWVDSALPDLPHSRFRRSSELYSLIGAIEAVSKSGTRLKKMDAADAGRRLRGFEKKTKEANLRGEAARYVLAASKHTDDLGPRTTRAEILQSLIQSH